MSETKGRELSTHPPLLWHATDVHANRSASMRSRFDCRLAFVTGDADRLEVAVIVSAALGDVYDVINLKVFGGQAANAARVVIADQDRFAFTAPRAATAA